MSQTKPSWAIAYPGLWDSLQLIHKPCPMAADNLYVFYYEPTNNTDSLIKTIEILGTSRNEIDVAVQSHQINAQGQLNHSDDEHVITVRMVQAKGCAKGWNMPATVEQIIRQANALL